MTNEEAINLIEEFMVIDDWSLVYLPDLPDALELAIKALKKPHGEWEIHSVYGRIYHLFCSECKKDAEDYISGSENWWLNSVPNFCPNCGADMRGNEK